jgi:peptidoglycan-N-acetylglucosamine deacetylase
MAIRPLAVSVVLAAALLGTNVMHDGGASVRTPGEASVPSSSPGGIASPTVSGSLTPQPSPSADPGASPTPEAIPFRAWAHGPRTAKVVALTFDDGWNVDRVRKIVKILKAKHAPATFFPVGRAVQRHPQTWRMIAEAGFPIGNHSWNHDNLAKMSAAKAAADIQRSTRLIERVTRVALFPVLRPPGGALDKTLLRVVRENGLKAVVMWDVDTRDWTGRPPRSVYRATLDAKSGSIILMHTDKDNTVKALPRIIDKLRKRGYTLVTIGQLIGLPGPVPTFGASAQPSASPGDRGR